MINSGKLISFLVLLMPSTVSADEFCVGLRSAFAEAINHFVPLRDSFNFDFDEYRGNVTFGQLVDCATTSSDGVADYYCRSGRISPDDIDAGSLLQYYSDAVSQCYGSEVRIARRSDAVTRFKHLLTQDDFTVQVFQRDSSRNGPYVSVKVTIVAVDQNQ